MPKWSLVSSAMKSRATTRQVITALDTARNRAELMIEMRRSSRRSSQTWRSCSGPVERGWSCLDRAGAVDDAAEPAGEHVEQRADAGEHEDGRQRQRDRLRDGGDAGERWGSWRRAEQDGNRLVTRERLSCGDHEHAASPRRVRRHARRARADRRWPADRDRRGRGSGAAPAIGSCATDGMRRRSRRTAVPRDGAGRGQGRPALALPVVAAGPAWLAGVSIPGSYWPFRGFPVAEDAGDAVFDAALDALAGTARWCGSGRSTTTIPQSAPLLAAARARGWTAMERHVARWLAARHGARSRGAVAAQLDAAQESLPREAPRGARRARLAFPGRRDWPAGSRCSARSSARAGSPGVPTVPTRSSSFAATAPSGARRRAIRCSRG